MRTQTFTGATSREVLQKVKQALGEDALILSNRARDGEIEVVALAAAALSSQIVTTSTPALEEADDDVQVSISPQAAAGRQTMPAAAHVIQHFRTLEQPAHAVQAAPAPTPVPVPAPAAPVSYVPESPAAARQAAADIDGILTEIQSLKNILRNDIAGLASMEHAPAAPGRSTVVRELLNAGFSVPLSRRLAGDAHGAEASEKNMEAVAARMQSELKIADADEIINAGGVYAFVGPTGVGKTTTVAKLAARAVVRFGASKVALLTTDGYRIGAHDQLRIYGRILSVPVHVVRDANDLAAALAELSGRHLVLIDTIGMSQRDRMVAEHAAMLSAAGEVKRVLLVSTTANTATLNQVVSAYKSTGVHGCILTKTDEAAALAPALDAVMRHQLPIHYVTDGQRVPEDLQLPEASVLVREALKPADDAFDIMADELSVALPPSGTPASHAAVVMPAAEPVVPAVAPAAQETSFIPAIHAMRPVHHVHSGVVHG
jgi:flagellar biosynthesis protein FlhF